MFSAFHENLVLKYEAVQRAHSKKYHHPHMRANWCIARRGHFEYRSADMLTESTLSTRYSSSSAVGAVHPSAPRISVASFSRSADRASSHWPRGYEHPVCLSTGAAAEHDKQMHSVSCVAACICMSRFNHLTRDWDLWREHLCWGIGEKGIAALWQTHCHLWHLSLSSSYLQTAISLLNLSNLMGGRWMHS